MTTRSEILSTMAMTTSASMIAIILIIIASVGGIKLSMVTLVVASIIILSSLSPMLGTSRWFPTAVLAPIGSTTSIVTSNFHSDNNCSHLHIALLAQGEGEVVVLYSWAWS